MEQLFSQMRQLIIIHHIPITAGTDPDTVGVSGTIKFHSPFVFSVATGAQGTDEAPTITNKRAYKHSIDR